MRSDDPERMLERACGALSQHQLDGGWGLTPTQVQSIVNTAEVSLVMNQVDPYQRFADTCALALGYLQRSLPEHCRPRSDGGRGERTRFVTFALLAAGSDQATDKATHRAIGEWALSWLESSQLDSGGWSEQRAGADASLFQTSLGLRALGRATAIVDEARVRLLVDRAVLFLTESQLPSGGFPTFEGSSTPSPTKTAVAVIALVELGESLDLDFAVQIEQATDWLLQNHARWERLAEADPEVQGTQWTHLAYAHVLEALALAKANLRDDRLKGAWRAVDQSWDERQGLWTELTNPPAVTIRANYAVGLAIGAALGELGRVGLGEVLASAAAGTQPGFDLLVTQLDTFLIAVAEDPGSAAPLRLSAAQTALLKQLARPWGAPKFRTARELAEGLTVAESSIGKMVKRLNDAVAKHEIPGLGKLVVSARRRGYSLSVRAVVSA